MFVVAREPFYSKKMSCYFNVVPQLSCNPLLSTINFSNPSLEGDAWFRDALSQFSISNRMHGIHVARTTIPSTGKKRS